MRHRLAPDANVCGSDSFSYTLNGGSSATVSITISCGNGAPQTVGVVGPRTHTERQTVSIALAPFFNDPDGDALSYSVTGLPASLSIDPTTGVISGTLVDGDAAGSDYSVVVTARDPDNASTTQSFALTVLPFSDAVFKDGFE